jgi:hypothetical protein
MTKKEIQQIIDRGWKERREKQLERRKKNSELVKKWTAREKNLTEEDANLKRWKHYLGLENKKALENKNEK